MPSLECVAVWPSLNASTAAVVNASSSAITTTTTLQCYFGWKLVGFVPYDSTLERVVGTLGFLVFVLASLGYAFHSVYVQQRGWFANAKLLAFYIGLAMLYPFAFLSDIVLVRGVDRHSVNFLLLIAQAFLWYAFLRRYIAVMLRVRRTRDGDSDTAHADYKSNKRHARYLTATFLAGLTAGQLAGGVVQLLSLITVAGLAALLAAVDLFGAMPSAQGGKRFSRLWRSFMPLRVATWVLGVYSMLVAVLSPGFLGALHVGGEAFCVFVEHLALAALAFCYWHAAVARKLAKTSLARSVNAWDSSASTVDDANGNGDGDDDDDNDDNNNKDGDNASPARRGHHGDAESGGGIMTTSTLSTMSSHGALSASRDVDALMTPIDFNLPSPTTVVGRQPTPTTSGAASATTATGGGSSFFNFAGAFGGSSTTSRSNGK